MSWLLALSTELLFLCSFSRWHSLSYTNLAPTAGGRVLGQMSSYRWPTSWKDITEMWKEDVGH